MARRLIFAILSALAASAIPAAAQAPAYYGDMVIGETRDIPCPATLNDFEENGRYVWFDGREFSTAWRSVAWQFPLPSNNWYEATPDRDVVSVDGKITWNDARILVHCWIHRHLYGLTRHYDHIGSSGRSSCTPHDRMWMWDENYDPYAAEEVQGDGVQIADLSCDSDGGGGGGGGSNPTCTPMEIQTSYDGGKTWTAIYKGNVCEAH